MPDRIGDDIDESWPLSPEQRCANGGENAVLHMELRGALDVLRLRAALRGVLARHEIFAQRFCVVPGFRGLRMQPASGPCEPDWREEDCRGRSAADVQAFIAAATRRDFAAADGVLIDALLLRTAEAEWQFALVASPLVVDRQSLARLYAELSEIYDGEAVAEPFQYLQFVEWRQALEAEGQDARAYWTPYFENAEPPRLPFRTARGASGRPSLRRPLDARALMLLRSFAAARDMTLETVAQAAWWALLARLAGSGRYAATWQHDCRRDYDVMASAVGVFEKRLPLHVDLDLAAPFDAWLARLAQMLDAHREAQEFWPIDEPPQDAHLHFVFAYADLPPPRRGSPEWRLRGLSEPTGVFELALQFACGDDEEGAELSLRFDAARYRPEAILCLLDQYAMLLEGVALDPDRPIRELPLDEAERAPAITGASLDLWTEPLPQRIARSAKETPEAIALRSAARGALSYAELQKRVDHLAASLQARGAGRGQRIALGFERSADLVVALLAVWRAGAAYVPLEPNWPAARRDAVLADARPLLVLDAVDWTDIERFAPAMRPVDVELEDAAYVLYTSGSTGTPKGVVVAHGQLLNYVSGASRVMELGAARRWALAGSVAADLGNTALFGALANGACLVVAEDGDLQDGIAFARFMREQSIDGLKIAPSQIEALLDGVQAPHLPHKLVLGGEAAPPALVRLVGALAPDCEIYNHYGPTETTVGVMVHEIERAAELESEVAPLGTVLPNNRVYVLDERLRPVPTGAVGELCIGGAQLGRYLDDAHRGAFVDDPFAPGERLYRSGDLACRLAEGGVRLLGRADQQVKIRGFRVEPAEIESVLSVQPGVRQALVALRGDQLCAYLVAAAELDCESGRRALRAGLAEILPDYMLPRHFVFVEAFPRLASGKIDRNALARLDLRTAPEDIARHAPPRDALETLLCEGMAELLKRDAIGVDEDFFELGGHSLLVIKFVARIRRLLKLEVPPGVVFDYPTASALAAELRARSGDPAQLEKFAALQQRIAAMDPEERAALRARTAGTPVAAEEAHTQ